jgi:hypothetical protein
MRNLLSAANSSLGEGFPPGFKLFCEDAPALSAARLWGANKNSIHDLLGPVTSADLFAGRGRGASGYRRGGGRRGLLWATAHSQPARARRRQEEFRSSGYSNARGRVFGGRHHQCLPQGAPACHSRLGPAQRYRLWPSYDSLVLNGLQALSPPPPEKRIGPRPSAPRRHRKLLGLGQDPPGQTPRHPPEQVPPSPQRNRVTLEPAPR